MSTVNAKKIHIYKIKANVQNNPSLQVNYIYKRKRKQVVRAQSMSH